MTRKFSRGLYCSIPQANPAEVSPEKHSNSNEFLLLILLFILLAASPSLGLDSSYFFIIILAVIGTGGVGKAFGLCDLRPLVTK